MEKMPKSFYDKLKPVKPNDFLWHLSRKENRENILKNGLILPDDLGIKTTHNLIFANNFYDDILSMWPIPIDIFYFSNHRASYHNYDTFKSAELGSITPYFDFWRIDAYKLKAQWYIDPFLINDSKVYALCKRKHSSYICTQNSIPAEFIQLFEYDEMHKEDVFYKKREGVVHFYTRKLPLKKVA